MSAPESATAWRRVRSGFERASSLAGAEREAFLSALRPPALGREVRALLAADAHPLPLLDHDALDLQRTLLGEADAAEWLGREVDGLQLLSILGQGGSATVYRARRARGAEPDVAVKVLRWEAASPAFQRRFEQERAALSSLDHPGLIRVLGAGAMPDGRPYLVTECVDGSPIDEWCRRAGRPQRDTLRLFVEVCRAVHHAHRHLVVHRDLKPTNILVTDAGEAKVLDFGIAKILDPERDPAWTDLYGRSPLTPAYASPEQVAGQAVSTASDVYSLGVLLFRLATGGSPYRSESGTALERSVRDEPPRSAREVALANGHPQPSRDLETILATALGKRPDQRYPSAEHLAEDIERLLADRPLRARREPWLRRAGRWVRRHPLTTGVLTTLLALWIGSWIGTHRSLERVRASETIAWRAHANAARSTAFLADLLEGIAQRGGIARDDLRVMLSEARLRVADLEETPEAQARLSLALAAAEAALGERASARTHALLALELSRSTRGLTWREVARSLEILIAIERTEPGASARAHALERARVIAEALGADSETARAAQADADELVAR